jgi:peptide/nickel transport system permease protein
MAWTSRCTSNICSTWATPCAAIFGIPFPKPHRDGFSALIGRTWPVSIALGIVTILIALPLGFLLGVLAATRQKHVDRLCSLYHGHTGHHRAQLCHLGLAAAALLPCSLRWLPTGGWGQWYHYIMPVIRPGVWRRWR